MNPGAKSFNMNPIAIAAIVTAWLLSGMWLLMWWNKDRYQFVQGKVSEWSDVTKSIVRHHTYFVLDRNTGEVVVVPVRDKDTGKEVTPYWEK